jgi:hypothetical protein
VGDDRVDHPHLEGLGRRVLEAEEEDLPGPLLSHLAGEVGRTEPPVEAGHVGIGLLEAGVLPAGDGEVGHDVEAVAAARRPPGHHADHHLGHEPDQPLHLEDVEAAGAAGIDGVGRLALGVAVAITPADALVAPRAERPTPVTGGRPVAGEQDATDVARRAGVVERPVQLVDRVGAEGVADLGSVEGDAHGAVVDGPVVGDVGEGEPLDRAPCVGVEQGGHRTGCGGIGHGDETTAGRSRGSTPPKAVHVADR